jgi:hypothetical protein
MKWRYLKILGSTIWGTNNLKRDDLVRLKNHGYDSILDLQEFKSFDADNNEWVDIEGDK